MTAEHWDMRDPAGFGSALLGALARMRHDDRPDALATEAADHIGRLHTSGRSRLPDISDTTAPCRPVRPPAVLGAQQKEGPVTSQK